MSSRRSTDRRSSGSGLRRRRSGSQRGRRDGARAAANRGRGRNGGRAVAAGGGRASGLIRSSGIGTVAIGALLLIAILFALSRIDFGETIREITLPLRHENVIRDQAIEKNVDADLIAAVIYAESRFRDQTSNAGARGLMQITPDTADTIETLSGGQTFEYDDLADPELNIRYGSFFLRHLLNRYGENEVAALAGYNAGITNADAWGGAEMTLDDIEFEETHLYVEQVLEKRKEYRQNYRSELGL